MRTIRETTITSANAVLLIRAPGIIDSFQRIHGFAPDSAWSANEVQMGETQMGVDGYQSGGFTPFEIQLVITLMANSPSQPVFNTMIRWMLQNQEIAPLDWSLELKSIKKRYAGGGFLVSGSPVPSGGKVLQPTNYTCNTVIEKMEDL